MALPVQPVTPCEKKIAWAGWKERGEIAHRKWKLLYFSRHANDQPDGQEEGFTKA